MGDAPGQVLRTRVSTGDPDEARCYQQVYARFRAEPTPREGFTFSLDSTAAGSLRIDYLRHSGRFHAEADPSPALTVVEVLDGAMRISTDHTETTANVVLAPHWSPYTVEWEGVDLRVTTLDLAEVDRAVSEVADVEGGHVSFDEPTALSPARARFWTALVDHVDRQVLAQDALLASPLVRRESLRRLVAGALTVFPHDAHGHGPDGADAGEPATVRRAVEFMDAHAQEDIDITQVAEASRIGARGLQIAFRRHRGQTPWEYLRRIRLEGAHRELQAADTARGDTVAAIAARWGFAHPGRFSVEYRHAFGTLPSATLRC